VIIGALVLKAGVRGLASMDARLRRRCKRRFVDVSAARYPAEFAGVGITKGLAAGHNS
jgi:hypothetical protein